MSTSNPMHLTVMQRLLAYDEALEMTDAEVEEYVKEYVQNGIKVLKEKHGEDFVDYIDPLLLDLGSATHCVLGQLYENAEPTQEQWAWLGRELGMNQPERDAEGYTKGLAILDGDVAHHPDQFGFEADDATYYDLTAAWLEALRAEVAKRAENA